MATFHSGKGGTATVNGTELAVTDWSVDPSTEIARFRNSKTGNFTKKETTFKEATLTITVDYDFDANPFSSLPLGTTVTNVKLYLQGGGAGGSGGFWDFPSAIVVSTPQSVAVNGNIQTSFNLENDGTFSAPA